MRDLISQGIKAQMCVTSPPYWGLRDYGVEGQLGMEKTIEEYVGNMVEVFGLVWELLKDDGTLWLNLGDSYNGYPGNVTRGGLLSGINQHARQFKTSGYGLSEKALKPKDLCGIPWRVAFALQSQGWYLRSDIIWAKPNPMPESVTDRPTKSHEYLFLLTKNERYYYDQEAIKELGKDPEDDIRRIAQQKSDNKSVPDEKKQGLRVRSPAGWKTGKGSHGSFHENGREETISYNEISSGRNKRSVWTVPTNAYPEAHFATFPPKLIEPCILAGSRPGDIIFDPFLGSGTTAMVAQNLGRRWIGIELNKEYEKLQKKRIAQLGMEFSS